ETLGVAGIQTGWDLLRVPSFCVQQLSSLRVNAVGYSCARLRTSTGQTRRVARDSARANLSLARRSDNSPSEAESMRKGIVKLCAAIAAIVLALTVGRTVAFAGSGKESCSTTSADVTS